MREKGRHEAKIGINELLENAYDDWKSSQGTIVKHGNYPWAPKLSPGTIDPSLTPSQVALIYLDGAPRFFEHLFNIKTTPPCFSNTHVIALFQDLCHSAETIYFIHDDALRNALLVRLYQIKISGHLKNFPAPLTDNLTFRQWFRFFYLIFNTGAYGYKHRSLDVYPTHHIKLMNHLNTIGDRSQSAFVETLKLLITPKDYDDDRSECLYVKLLRNLVHTTKPSETFSCLTVIYRMITWLPLENNDTNKNMIAAFLNGNREGRCSDERPSRLRKMFAMLLCNLPPEERKEAIPRAFDRENLLHFFFNYERHTTAYDGTYTYTFQLLSPETLVYDPALLSLKKEQTEPVATIEPTSEWIGATSPFAEGSAAKTEDDRPEEMVNESMLDTTEEDTSRHRSCWPHRLFTSKSTQDLRSLMEPLLVTPGKKKQE